MKKNKGFTLFELIITMAVFAIVAAIALPGFGDLIDRRQLNSYTVEMVGGIHAARSEAITQRINITMEPNTGNDWTTGWRVVDPDDNIILEHEAFPDGYAFNTVNGSTSFTFTARGRLTSNGETMTITNNSSNTKTIEIPASGTPYIR